MPRSSSGRTSQPCSSRLHNDKRSDESITELRDDCHDRGAERASCVRRVPNQRDAGCRVAGRVGELAEVLVLCRQHSGIGTRQCGDDLVLGSWCHVRHCADVAAPSGGGVWTPVTAVPGGNALQRGQRFSAAGTSLPQRGHSVRRCAHLCPELTDQHGQNRRWRPVSRRVPPIFCAAYNGRFWKAGSAGLYDNGRRTDLDVRRGGPHAAGRRSSRRSSPRQLHRRPVGEGPGLRVFRY